MKEKSNEEDILTFGELKVGQKFIGMPIHGDNAGHGGYRGMHWLFIKTRMKVTGYGVPHGKSVRINDGQECDEPNGMPVILIE